MGNFTDKDKGWNKMITTFKVNSGETAGFVGYLRSSGEYKKKQTGKGSKTSQDEITMAQLAAVHERGSSDGTILQRSFMGSAIDENSKDLKRLVKKMADAVVMGKLSKKQGIGLVCQKLKDLFIAKINSNVQPALKKATEKRKGSSHTLIDTGQLKNSIDWEVKAGKDK